MKKTLPDKSTDQSSPRPLGQALRPVGGIKSTVSPRIKYVTGALTGLMLCTLALYWWPDAILGGGREVHRLQGVLFLDPDADQKRSATESLLPFVKLNLYADLNDNRILDPEDLKLSSTLSDERGGFDLQVQREQTFMTRVKHPQHEANENLVSGSVQVAQPFLSLGGDDNVSSLTALRFEEVKIPKDAKIKRSFIRLRSYSDNDERPMLWIAGELQTEPGQFEDAPGNLSERSQTKKGLFWECQSWQKDRFYQSPDLSKIVQELLAYRGNSPDMTFMIEGSEGIKEAYSSLAYSPQLVIQYELPQHDYLLEIDPAYAPNNGMPKVRWLAFENHQDLSIPYQGNPPLCYGITADQKIASFNWQSGLSTGFNSPTKAVPEVQHLVMLSHGQKLMGLREGRLGTVSLPEGQFQAVTLKGSAASSKLIALTFDPFQNQLWAISQNRHLLTIDPTDWSAKSLGKINAKTKQEILYLSYDASQERLLFLQKSEARELHLWSLEPEDGQAQFIGPLQYQGQTIHKVIGMLALPDGHLSIITGNEGPVETQNLLLKINPHRLHTEEARLYPDLVQLEKCGCIVPPPHRISGTVFDDLNHDRKRSSHEKAYPEVRVNILWDENENQEADDTDPLVVSLLTDEQGQYSWQSYQSDNFLVQVDTSTLPEGIVLIGETTIPIDFRGYTGGGQGPGKPFNATHRSRVAALKWVQLKVRQQDNNGLLTWTTESTNDEGTFYVMRSTDGINYETIGRVEPEAPSDLTTQYHFTDGGILDLGYPVVAYRIRRVSALGESFSEVVKLPLNAAQEYISLQVSPGNHRPVSVRYRTQENGQAQIRVINLAGKAIYAGDVPAGPEMRQLEIQNDSWRSGIYYLQLETNQHSRMKKFIVK
jgi:hypothetical protein